MNTQDYISIGLDQDIAVVEATSKNHPLPETEKQLIDGKWYFNTRAVPAKVSSNSFAQMANEENISEEPKLRFEYLNKYLEGEVQECEAGEKYSLGRGDSNDIVIDLEYVSKKHLLIYYDNELGWVFENLSLNSSTWMHPK